MKGMILLLTVPAALVLSGLLLWLQFRLSGKSSRWPGLVIPAVFLVITLAGLACGVFYLGAAREAVSAPGAAGDGWEFDENGFIKERFEAFTGGQAGYETGEASYIGINIMAGLSLAFPFLMTVASLGVYAFRRERMRRGLELEKMARFDLG